MKRNGTAYMMSIANQLTDLVATQQHNLKGEVHHIQIESMILSSSYSITVVAFDKNSKCECMDIYDFYSEEKIELMVLAIGKAMTKEEYPSLEDFIYPKDL